MQSSSKITDNITNATSDWQEVAHIDDIPRLGARVIGDQDGDIAIFRCADDEIFALRDRCPHKGGPLSQGIVHGKQVTCPLHNWVLGLDDGEAIAPDVGCATTFPVKVSDGKVYIEFKPKT